MGYSLAMTTPMDDHGRPAVPGSINGGLFKREGELSSSVVTVDVDDIDAALKKITALGGDVPGKDGGSGDGLERLLQGLRGQHCGPVAKRRTGLKSPCGVDRPRPGCRGKGDSNDWTRCALRDPRR